MTLRSPKDPAESVVVQFDFATELAAIGSAVTTIAVHSGGTDPGVATMLDGAPQISGASVLQRVRGGLHGLSYTLRCVATSGATVLVRAGVMAVRWDGT